MNSKSKLIALTVCTSFFWIVLIAVTVAFAPRTDRIETQFLASTGGLGMFYGINTKTQNVTLVVEELPFESGATGSVELIRRELAPKQSLRVGVRELDTQSK